MSTEPSPEDIVTAVEDANQRDIDLVISNILRTGLFAAAGTMILGAVLNVIQNPAEQLDLHKFHGEPAQLRTIPGIITFALHGDAAAVMQLAVVLLLATPFLRVLFAIYAFAQQRDRRFVAISSVVLLVLIIGLFLGVEAG